jgi:pimeloyl-ACP methyl ester carboxylesterase
LPDGSPHYHHRPRGLERFAEENDNELHHDQRQCADLLQGLGHRPAVVFSHGWPLTADAWDAQMVFLAGKGCRCIAHDRRGHGRSSQPWNGNEMDTYADDLAALAEALDLRNTVHVGHSTGGGEVARYLGRHGTGRVAKAVLIGAVTPLQSAKLVRNSTLKVYKGLSHGMCTINQNEINADLLAFLAS